MDASDEIRAVVAGINAAWLAGRREELTRFFDPDVVFVRPDFGGRLVGRDACVQSFHDFMAQAKVHSFDAGEIEVDVVGPSAVASFRYSIDYEFERKRWRAEGRDLLVLTMRDGSWRVMWRWPQPATEHVIEEGSANG